MKVLLAFAGSRGDAQPGVLIGRELAGRGHQVTVAVSPNLVKLAERHGASAVPFGIGSDELLRAQRDDPRFRGLNPVDRVRAVLDLQRRGFAEAARDLDAIAEDNDVLVTGMACEEVATEVARHHAIPLAAVHFFPIRPNRAVPVIPAAWAGNVPGELHRLGWRALTTARARALAPELAAFRRAAASEQRGIGRRGAPDRLPRDLPAYTAVQAYDPEMFPGLAEDHPDLLFTGFPVPSDDIAGHEDAPGGPPDVARGSTELERWLRDGAAPVYVGFGSMPVADPVAAESVAREACRRLGLRLLLVGNMFRGRFADDIAVVDQVDHGAVLPLCAAAVHHGGAGTTAAVLRAGIPSVICSVQADQPYWGRQVEALRLGATAPFVGLSANRLERLLIRATAPEVVARAAAYGERFRDDGVSRAADVIESIAPDSAVRETPSMIGGVR